MPNVLTESAVLQCAHGGSVKVQAGQQKLKVDGKAVLLQSDLLAATVSNCPNTNAAAGQAPCLKVTSILSGLSTDLLVDGQPVMLENATGLTNATPPLPVMWQVQAAGQSKLAAQ